VIVLELKSCRFFVCIDAAALPAML